MCPSASSNRFSGCDTTQLPLCVCIRQTYPHLEVSIHDVQAVQVLQRQNHLSSVKACGVLRKLALGLEVCEEFTTSHKVHDQVELGGVLKVSAKVDDKGVTDLPQDAALGTRMGNLCGSARAWVRVGAFKRCLVGVGE